MGTKQLTTKEIQEIAGRPGAVIDGRVIHHAHPTDLVEPDLAFVVYGAPAPQGSKKMIGNNRMVEASGATLGPWRNAVRHMAEQAIAHKGDAWTGPISSPVMIGVTFSFGHTAASRKRGDIYHTNTPDLDKLQRAIGDALAPVPVTAKDLKGLSKSEASARREEIKADRLSQAVLANDSLIAAWCNPMKVYCGMTQDALAHPGATIEVWRLPLMPVASSTQGESA